MSSVLSACNICQTRAARGDGEEEDDEGSIAPGWLAKLYNMSGEDESAEMSRDEEALAASVHPSQEASREGPEDLLATLMSSTEEPYYEESVHSSRHSSRMGSSKFGASYVSKSRESEKRMLLSVQDPDGVSTKSAKSSFRSRRSPRGSYRNVRLGVQYDEEEDMFKHMTNDKFPVLVPKCVDDDFDLDNPEHMKLFEEQFAPQIQESANKVRAMGQAPQRKAITDHEVNMLMKGFNIDSNYEIRVQRAKDVTEESIEYLNHEIVAQNMEQLNRHLTRSGLKYADSQRAVNAGLSMNYKAIFLDRDPHYARHASQYASHNAQMKRKETSKKLTRAFKMS